MRKEHRSFWKPAVWIASCALLLPLAATADAFTVTLDNGNTLTSRYQPRLSMPDETKVMLLTDTGNWISLPRERVVGVSSRAELRGFGRVINTTTIALGFAPNEGSLEEEAAAADPTTQLLRYLTERDSTGERDYSVEQFVDTEGAGQGGFPSNYGGGGFGGGGFGGGSPRGSRPSRPGIVSAPPPPSPASGDGVQ